MSIKIALHHSICINTAQNSQHQVQPEKQTSTEKSCLKTAFHWMSALHQQENRALNLFNAFMSCDAIVYSSYWHQPKSKWRSLLSCTLGISVMFSQSMYMKPLLQKLARSSSPPAWIEFFFFFLSFFLGRILKLNIFVTEQVIRPGLQLVSNLYSSSHYFNLQ